MLDGRKAKITFFLTDKTRFGNIPSRKLCQRRRIISAYVDARTLPVSACDKTLKAGCHNDKDINQYIYQHDSWISRTGLTQGLDEPLSGQSREVPQYPSLTNSIGLSILAISVYLDYQKSDSRQAVKATRGDAFVPRAGETTYINHTTPRVINVLEEGKCQRRCKTQISSR
jgi:hypothetical protein